MEEELNPCPFCGGKELNITRDDYNNWTVFCGIGAAMSPTTPNIDTYKEAVTAWNKRFMGGSDNGIHE